MSRTATISRDGSIKMRPKAICEHASMDKWFSTLEGGYVRSCRCASSPSHPVCIEDYRTKKVVCKYYSTPIKTLCEVFTTNP